MDQVYDPEGAFDDPRGTRRIPLHHADVVGGDKARGITLGIVEERGLLGQDRFGVFRFAEVIDPARPAAFLRERGELPAEPGRVEAFRRDPVDPLSMHEVTGEVDVKPWRPIRRRTFAPHRAELFEEIDHVANGALIP